MSTKPFPALDRIEVSGSSSRLDRLLRGVIQRRFSGLQNARLTVIDPWGKRVFGDSRERTLKATIRVKSSRFYRDLVVGGALGAAESYLERRWDCDDLTDLFRALVLNVELSDEFDRGLISRIRSAAARFSYWARSNTRDGSRRNIRDHYDLGNDFFAQFLDPTMTYSAGIFESPDYSMKQASMAKLDRICRKLRLRPQDHVLEIGSGWGSFAIHAARKYGCRVTTTTLSAEQFELAGQRIRQSGLENRIEILRRDYRDLTGLFDKLVSIEMVEAVGHRYLPTYFGQCSRLLKPDGQMLLQAITLPDHRYEKCLRSVDFIKHYIFPGSCVPSLSAMTAALARASDLRVVNVEDIGAHYATTLKKWRERFHRNLEKVRRFGYPERLIRLWTYYLSYCEAGFAESYLGDLQILLSKPGCRLRPMLPPLNAAT